MPTIYIISQFNTADCIAVRIQLWIPHIGQVLPICRLTISTLMATFTPPAFSKAHGKFSNPAPSADFNMMKMAPKEPRRGTSDPREGLDSMLMLRILSRANSSIVFQSTEIAHLKCLSCLWYGKREFNFNETSGKRFWCRASYTIANLS